MLARSAVAVMLATAGFGVTASIGGLNPASADPGPPVDPAIPVPAPADPSMPLVPGDPAARPPIDPSTAANFAAEPQSVLDQLTQGTQVNPFSAMKGLIGEGAQPAMVLGTTPPRPEMDTTYLKPNQDPLSLAAQLKPQNFRMPAPDQLSPYALSPNDNPSPFARVDAFKGVHAVTHGSLGRMPGSELGQPLPGTAPPPGTNIPAGLEQFYIDPTPVPPEAPPAPQPVPPNGSDTPVLPAAAEPPLLPSAVSN